LNVPIDIALQASGGSADNATMQITEREMAVGELRPGMYVSRLDRDWLGTPWLLQGCLIQGEDDIHTLRQYCARVTVDIEKSENFVRAALLRAPRQGYVMPDLESARKGVPRPVVVSLEEELPRAQAATDAAYSLTRDILDSLRAGDRLDNAQVEAAVQPVVGTVLRNPDAYFWLEALRGRDGYAYTHAMGCCALMAAFGRHLGFPDEVLTDLATGGLLMDIGKTALASDMLGHDGPLSPEQAREMRRHVAHSVELYDRMDGARPVVREILQTHHERENGSGYPFGLVGDDIPLSGRLAGIVDTYDAMTSKRPFQEPTSRYDTLQIMYRERGQLYQADLLEQFVQCLGAYPVGSLVELSTGEIGMVMAQNQVRRLFPRVMLLTDAHKQVLKEFKPLDLRETWAGPDPARISIRKGVAPGSYGLDPKELYL
jgi:HD-GYP domain-containing protein (c-di-GMP phosphodiesterase class II)